MKVALPGLVSALNAVSKIASPALITLAGLTKSVPKEVLGSSFIPCFSVNISFAFSNSFGVRL